MDCADDNVDTYRDLVVYRRSTVDFDRYDTVAGLTAEDLTGDDVTMLLETPVEDGGVDPVEYLNDVRTVLDQPVFLYPDTADQLYAHVDTAWTRYLHHSDTGDYTAKRERLYKTGGGMKGFALAATVTGIATAFTDATLPDTGLLAWIGGFTGSIYTVARREHRFDQYINNLFSDTLQELGRETVPDNSGPVHTRKPLKHAARSKP